MASDTLLLTGAAGRIGQVLRPGLRRLASELRVADRVPLEPQASGERCVATDLSHLDEVLDLVRGVDAIVHLAAISTEAPFPDIVDNNIRATYTILEAARRAGVGRVLLASSNHVTGMYPRHVRVGPDAPLRPDTFYGVGKACDEALGRLYADKFGLTIACLRIGTFDERPRDERSLATWLSPGDALRLVTACLQAPPFGFAVLYGVSANRRSWWDNPAAGVVGYAPRDDADAAASAIGAPFSADSPAAALQGGPFALPETSIFD